MATLTDRAEIESILAATDDELMASLGEMLGGGASRDTDPKSSRARAEAWLRRNHERLRSAVCGRLDSHEFGDAVVDIAAVADLFATMLSKPMAFTVAAILLKRGIQTLCA